MLRLGAKYQHFVHGRGCPCASPALQQASRRVDAFARRQFLAGAGAAAFTAASASGARAQVNGARTLFTRARLFDGKSGALRSAQVLVDGVTIAAIDAGNNPPPAGASVIDCGGRVLMPGLIDAHWHTLFAAVPVAILATGDPGFVFAASTAEAERTLLRGFTTIRDLGGHVFSFKQAIDAGVIAGPRIYPSGAMVTTSGGHGDLRAPTEMPRDGGQISVGEAAGHAAIADGRAEVRLRVREQLLQGASQVKIVGGGGVSSPRSPLDMTTFGDDELAAAVEVARDWNTYITVHAYTPRTAQRAIRAGAACIEHAHLIDDETARLMARRNVWLSTQPFLSMDDTGAQSGPSADRARMIFAGTPALYQLVRRRGIKTAWGSDLLFSPELAPRQSVMLTHLANWYANAEVLRIATSVNADLMALSGMRDPYPGKLGVVEPGAYADLLVVNGDPIADIRLLEDPARNLSVIMKDGRIHKNIL